MCALEERSENPAETHPSPAQVALWELKTLPGMVWSSHYCTQERRDSFSLIRPTFIFKDELSSIFPCERALLRGKRGNALDETGKSLGLFFLQRKDVGSIG